MWQLRIKLGCRTSSLIVIQSYHDVTRPRRKKEKRNQIWSQYTTSLVKVPFTCWLSNHSFSSPICPFLFRFWLPFVKACNRSASSKARQSCLLVIFHAKQMIVQWLVALSYSSSSLHLITQRRYFSVRLTRSMKLRWTCWWGDLIGIGTFKITQILFII